MVSQGQGTTSTLYCDKSFTWRVGSAVEEICSWALVGVKDTPLKLCYEYGSLDFSDAAFTYFWVFNPLT